MGWGHRGIVLGAAWLAIAAAPAPDKGADPNQSPAATNMGSSLHRIADAQAAQANPSEYQAPCADGEYKSKSDLCAQWYAARAARDAANAAWWAIWITVVSLALSAVGLALLLWQIRLTRAAVEDTSEATSAMREANRLQAIAQRPWVTIEPSLYKAAFRDEVLTIGLRVNVKNIGHSVAENMTAFAIIIRSATKIDDNIESARSRVEDPGAFLSPLVPGDEKSLLIENDDVASEFSLSEVTGRAEYFIFVAVRYSVPGDPERKITERMYYVSQNKPDEPFGPVGLEYPINPALGLEDVTIHAAGRVRAT